MADKDKKKSDRSAVAYDKRIIDRNVSKGLLSRADVEGHMKGLPDLKDQADNIADKVWGAEPR